MTTRATWQLDGLRARLVTARLAAVVNLERPAQGLHAITIDGRPQAEQSWLGIELTGPPPAAAEIESYVRESDLIVTYGETTTRPLRAQVYWRAVSCELARTMATVEMLASVQTSLLDICPRLVAHSTLPQGELLSLDAQSCGVSAESLDGGAPCGYLLRPRDAQYSYLELVVAGTLREHRVESLAGGQRLIHELFADRLEKGVILRTRIRGVLIERQDDLATAALHLADFAESALPLTT